MSWKEKVKEYGGGNFTFLSEDGEIITFIVVGEPVLMKSVYKGKEQERIGCPVVTEDGYQLFICGKRLFRRLAKHESVFDVAALQVTRIGAEGDVNAKYPVQVIDTPDIVVKLQNIRDNEFAPDMIQESVDEATKVLIG